MVRKAVITDAGFASRYLPITKTIPKGMLPMWNKPIIQLVVEECVQGGIEEIIIVATPEGKPIYEDFFNNSVNRIRKQLTAQGKEDRYAAVQEVLDFPKITVITQDQSLPYGNGSPLLSAKSFLINEDAFMYIYSDDVVLGEIGAVKALIEEFNKDNSVDALVATQEVQRDQISKFGCVKFKEGSSEFMEMLIEKPEPDEAPSLLAAYGRYLFKQSIFTYLMPEELGKDGELWTTDAIDKQAKAGKVKVVRVPSLWMTTGDPENYIKAHMEYLRLRGKL